VNARPAVDASGERRAERGARIGLMAIPACCMVFRLRPDCSPSANAIGTLRMARSDVDSVRMTIFRIGNCGVFERSRPVSGS
jgi:hypothetical protein